MTQVTGFAQSVTLPNKVHVTQGISLFKIDVGDSSQSNDIRVFFTWLDPQDDPKVLHHGWIQVALYYPVGATTSGAVTFTPPGGSPIYVKQDPATLNVLNTAAANATMLPSVSGVSTFYVIVNIMNAAGHNPSGQQGTAESLQFDCTAR